MKKYLLTKEETCPTCQGNYQTLNPDYEREEKEAEDNESSYFPDEYIECRDCKEGIKTTEVSLEDALKDILSADMSGIRLAIAEHIRY